MAILKSLRNRIRKILHPDKELKVYSHKARRWVTIFVPECREDLIMAELSKFESKFEVPKLPVTKVFKSSKPSMSPIEERNEWIRTVKTVPNITPAKREEYIKILGSEYDSVEALLSITIPHYNDPISPTTGHYVDGIMRDGAPYCSAGEIEFVVRLGDDLNAQVMLKAIRVETWKRENQHWAARSRGYCCTYQADREELWEYASDNLCCEKEDPQDWELDHEMMERSARLKRRRLEDPEEVHF